MPVNKSLKIPEGGSVASHFIVSDGRIPLADAVQRINLQQSLIGNQ